MVQWAQCAAGHLMPQTSVEFVGFPLSACQSNCARPLSFGLCCQWQVSDRGRLRSARPDRPELPLAFSDREF